MGTLRSNINWEGMDVNGCHLATPAVNEQQQYVWDHPILPDGHITDEGEVILDGPTQSIEP